MAETIIMFTPPASNLNQILTNKFLLFNLQPYVTVIATLELINASCSSLSNIRLISLPSTQLPSRQGRQMTFPSSPRLRQTQLK
ncbi:MAG: hypothetical protein ACTTJF_07575 [Campylobacter sp.]|uniref:hypothetical protein n=1 Tax=Campylobacter sp. TaxID=205 RepID=UPI003FA170AC